MTVDIIVQGKNLQEAFERAGLGRGENAPRCFYVIDETVSRLYSTVLPFDLRPDNHYISKSGEWYKSLDEAANVWDGLLENEYTKKDVLVAIGGGVVGDLSGLAASCYKRGMRFVLVPTTLLSMVDSSIGAKTGLNYGSVKNSIGSYYEAEKRILYYGFLESLPREEVLCGLAEMIKIAAVYDKDLFERIEELGYDAAFDRQCIERAMELKIDIVTRDPFERNLRKILNFGHTMGHAIEAYKLDQGKIEVKHGYAVARGMLAESELGLRLGLTANEAEARLRALIGGLGFGIGERIEVRPLLPYLRNDKKKEGKGLVFALMTEIGRAEMVEVGEEEVLA